MENTHNFNNQMRAEPLITWYLKILELTMIGTNSCIVS